MTEPELDAPHDYTDADLIDMVAHEGALTWLRDDRTGPEANALMERAVVVWFVQLFLDLGPEAAKPIADFVNTLLRGVGASYRLTELPRSEWPVTTEDIP